MKLVINKQRDRQKGLSAFLLFLLLKRIPAFPLSFFSSLVFWGLLSFAHISIWNKNQEEKGKGKETRGMQTETGVGILDS